MDNLRLDLLKQTTLPIASNIDRSGAIDFGFRVDPIDPIPPVDPGFKTLLVDLCIQRALELAAYDRPIMIYWSGGLDSTAVLSSFLMANVFKDQITVVMNSSSIAEYPLFYEKFIKDQLQVRMTSPSLFPSIRTDEMMVTGEIGDQIFGSVILNGYQTTGDYEATLSMHWHKHIERMYRKEYRKLLIAMYEPFVARAPFKIKSVYDFLWWVNFACKWQHVVCRMAGGVVDPLEFMRNVQHFYRTDYFQQWSMNESNHRCLKTASNHTTYKLALRQVIQLFTGDAEYVKHKQKIGSLPLKFTSRYMMLLDDGRRIRFGGPMCDDPIDYNAKYGDLFDHLFSKNRVFA